MYVTTSQCNEENLYLNVVPPVQVISKIRRHPAQLSHRNQRLHSNKFIQHNGIFVVCLSSRIYVSCLLCTVSPVTHTASLSPFSSHIYQHANRKNCFQFTSFEQFCLASRGSLVLPRRCVYARKSSDYSTRQLCTCKQVQTFEPTN
jgi:hypothetical protein